VSLILKHAVWFPFLQRHELRSHKHIRVGRLRRRLSRTPNIQRSTSTSSSCWLVHLILTTIHIALPYDRCHDLEQELVFARAREEAALIREENMQAENYTTACQLRKAEARAEELAARVKELEGERTVAAEAKARAKGLVARVKELEGARAKTTAAKASRRRSAPWRDYKSGKRGYCAMCVCACSEEKSSLIRCSRNYSHWLKTQPGVQGNFSAKRLRVRLNRLKAEEHAVCLSYQICALELKILYDSGSRHRRTRASQATFANAAGSATG
jgi:hypothetical protein